MLFIPNKELVKAEAGPWHEVNSDMPRPLHYIKAGTIAIHATGVNKFVELVRDHMPEKPHQNDSATEPPNATDGYSYADFMNVAIHNPSKLRQFDEKSDALTGGDAAGISVLHDVTGDTLDIGRFMDGEPECFASLTNGTPRAKRVHFVVDGGAWHGVSSSEITRRSSRVMRLIDWLEAQNIRCAMTVVFSNPTRHIEIEAKQYHEPLNLNDIAVATHSGMLRRLVWRAVEYSKRYEPGYGSSNTLTQAISYNANAVKSDDMSELPVFIGNDYNNDLTSDFDKLEKAIAGELERDIMRPLTVLT